MSGQSWIGNGIRIVTTITVLIGLLAGTVWSQSPSDELEAYLAARQRVVSDRSRPIEERERTALEMAAALDRATGRAATAREARQLWSRASRLLEEFQNREPDHPQTRLFQGQASVYRWAVGRSWADQFANHPGDSNARSEAIRAFDEAIAALRPLVESGQEDDPQSPEFRYRLAQALADRARLEPEDSEERRTLQEQALEPLSKPITEPRLEGFAELLRADLLTDLGRFEDAEKALDAAEGAAESPPISDRVAARVALRIGQGRLDDAEKALRQLPEGDAETLRESLSLKIALARWKAASESPADRQRAETEAFRLVDWLRESGEGATARLGLLALARVVREPAPNRSPEQLALLAEGALALGEPERAGQLYQRGAKRATEEGHHEQAASLRLSAGSVFFRLGKFAEAEQTFAELAQDGQAGPVRSRAALLRALAIGQARDRRWPGYDRPRYLEALGDVSRDFPETSEAGEALWLSGQERREADDRTDAARDWEAIPRSHARWLDSRLALARLDRDEAEHAVGHSDPSAAQQALQKAREALEAVASELPSDDRAAQVEVALAQADLETLPEAGDPSRSLAILDRLLAGPLDDLRRARARRLRVLALSELGRYLDAETAARSLLETQKAADLLDLAGRLDRVAVSAPSDLSRRRAGELLRMIAEALREHPEKLSPSESAEARLRIARAEVFRGDPPSARALLQAWPEATRELPPPLWPVLADLAIEASDFDRSIAINRQIAQSQPVGSPPWFRARYGHALALERSGSPELALQLIQATSALHPNLGGGPIRDRFEALRKQLERP